MTTPTYNPIPKKIHQIWLGPFDPPLKWMNSWKDFCDKYNWEYKLWREDDIKSLGLINKKEFDKAKSYQEKADIARYEIIYKIGGLYIDCDMIWLQRNLENYIPFNSSHFVGVQEYPTNSIATIGPPYLSNGFFASCVNHKILARCISEIPERFELSTSHAFIKTGPVLLNKCIKETINIIPYHYIFPKDFHWKTNVEDPMEFSEKALVFTYNGAEYDHIKALRKLERQKRFSRK